MTATADFKVTHEFHLLDGGVVYVMAELRADWVALEADGTAWHTVCGDIWPQWTCVTRGVKRLSKVVKYGHRFSVVTNGKSHRYTCECGQVGNWTRSDERACDGGNRHYWGAARVCGARMKQKQVRLHTALCRLAERMDLVGVVVLDRGWGNQQIAEIEALAHEIAHRVVTGTSFESLLDEMSATAANRHEARALRVEVAALDRLGCRVSLRTLWEGAAWRGESTPPSWEAMTPAFTAREQRCVDRIVRMVKQSQCKRQWKSSMDTAQRFA